MNEAVSDLCVDYRWQAIDQENAEIALAKEVGRAFKPHIFENGDTRRQLLARSRHIVMKHFSKWTDSQRRRADILFREYPAIEEAYKISMKLTEIFNTKCDRAVALTKLARWYDQVERLNCKFFSSVIQTMQNNYGTIVNYFENCSTNASARVSMPKSRLSEISSEEFATSPSLYLDLNHLRLNIFSPPPEFAGDPNLQVIPFFYCPDSPHTTRRPIKEKRIEKSILMA